jgi:hypothetical protein
VENTAVNRALAMLLAAGSSVTLRADFSYQETTRIVGPSLQAHTVVTHLIKGNHMATLTKDHISVLDLDNATLTEVDLAKKTYTVKTFAQVKEAGGKTNGERRFKVVAKSTGQSKAIGVLNAKELVITMTLEGAGDSTGGGAGNQIVVHAWVATVPGFEDVKNFQNNLGQKLGYALGLPPEFEEVGKQINQLEGSPIEYSVRAGDAAVLSLQLETQIPPETSWLANALDRLSGISRLGRKKNYSTPKEEPSSGGVLEATTELSSFSAGPTDIVKFMVPQGFKKLEPGASTTPSK